MISSTFSRARLVRTQLPLLAGRACFLSSGLDTPAPTDTKLPPLPVTFEDVSKATFLIRSGIKYTPCDYSTSLSEICKTNVYLKKDFMQFTGSFKVSYIVNNIVLSYTTNTVTL